MLSYDLFRSKCFFFSPFVLSNECQGKERCQWRDEVADATLTLNFFSSIFFSCWPFLFPRFQLVFSPLLLLTSSLPPPFTLFFAFKLRSREKRPRNIGKMQILFVVLSFQLNFNDYSPNVWVKREKKNFPWGIFIYFTKRWNW